MTTDPTTPTDGSPEAVDTARPIDFTARYGHGVERGLSLGGGGVYFVAWQLAYLHGLASHGVDLTRADRVVGTSAGSLVAATLVGGHLRRVHAEISVLARAPSLVAALAPAGDLAPSQQRAGQLFLAAGDAEPDTVRSIGHAALAAITPEPATMVRHVGLVLGDRHWPSESLHVSCVDTYTGERCVVTAASEVPIAHAVAASSAVPGLFPPQPVGDRRCMDGGVSGSGTHLDLLAGADRGLVICLGQATAAEPAGTMTMSPDGLERELAALFATGTTVLVRSPSEARIEDLMSPSAVPKALSLGAEQAASDAEQLAAFWG